MKVLIAADGSAYSRAAIDEACRLFEKSPDTQFKVISVYELMIPTNGPFMMAEEYVQQIDDESQAQANSIAEKALAQIREKFPALALRTTTSVLSGAPAQRIVEEVENWGADLVVCGSHGYGFWKRAWLGSVSNSLVHNAPCSVMVVRVKHEAQSAAAQ
jgi:nucleotide-binding universal stress UspA family protein